MKKLKKIILISLLLLNASCYFGMERDNTNDPDSENFVSPAASADFNASVTEGNARLTVEFTDQSTGDIAAWEWDFDNDGIVDSTEKNPTCTYNIAGTYSVKLKVWESRWLVSDEKVMSNYIEVKVGYPVMSIVKNDSNGLSSIAAADIDNDGDIDIAAGTYGNLDHYDTQTCTDSVIYWLENTANQEWIEHSVAINLCSIRSIILKDIDNDGDIDIITAGKYSSGQSGIAWWENHKGEDDNWKNSWTFHIIASDFMGEICVKAIDMDNDGDMDIIGASYGVYNFGWENSEISWWENDDGTGASWIKHKLTGENTGVAFKWIRSIAIFDVDNDGDFDISYAERYSGKISMLENRKGEIVDWKNNFTEHTIDGSFSTAEAVYSADIDGDGDYDIIGVSYGTWNSGLGIYENSYVCWWENTNSSSWEKHIVNNESLDGGRAVVAKDMDGDGDADIVTASSNSDTVIWWENAGGLGNSWIQHVVNVHFHSAYSLDAADIDNDSDLDILGASMGNWVSADNYYYLSRIAWWEIIY